MIRRQMYAIIFTNTKKTYNPNLKVNNDEGDDGAYKISGNTLTITYTDDEDGTTTVLVLKRQ